MESAGLWMLLAVAAMMLATGLASWVVLTAVAGAFALAGGGLPPHPMSTLLPSKRRDAVLMAGRFYHEPAPRRRG